MPKKKNASSLISELKRKTRRNYSSEEKIRIIIEGMRGEITIAELCRSFHFHFTVIFALQYLSYIRLSYMGMVPQYLLY